MSRSYDQTLQALFNETVKASAQLDRVYRSLAAVLAQIDRDPQRYPKVTAARLRKLVPAIHESFDRATLSIGQSIGMVMQELTDRPKVAVRSASRIHRRAFERPARHSYIRGLKR